MKDPSRSIERHISPSQKIYLTLKETALAGHALASVLVLLGFWGITYFILSPYAQFLKGILDNAIRAYC